MLRAKPGPRTKPADERQDDLLNAAQHLFLTKGLINTTVEQITEAAGIGKGTFYLHFRSKEHVLASLRERYMHDFVARIATDVAHCSPNDWKGKLTTWARTAIAATLDTTALHDIVFSTPARPQPSDSDDSDTRILNNLAELLAAGHAAGAWRVDDAAFTAAFLFEGLHATLENSQRREPALDRDQFLAKVTRIFYRAVALLPE